MRREQPRPAESSPNLRYSSVAPQRLKRVEKAMESAVSAGPSVAGAFSPGERVRHDRFGEGAIVAIEGEGSNLKATVDFDNLGRKQLLLKFAKLSKL